MIDAKELRIGNWVEHPHVDEFFKVLEVNIKAVSIGHKQGNIIQDVLKPEELLPITLTPEILEKCGFEKETRGKSEDFDGEEIVFCLEGVDLWLLNDETFAYATYTRYPGRGFKGGLSITTLHQLQNLFYALTNTELNVEWSVATEDK